MTFNNIRTPGARVGAAGLLAAILMTIAASLAPAANASEPAADPKAAAFEVDFLTGMIDHHHMAVMMAEPCMVKAQHTELRAMCDSIVTVQSSEIETMQGWLQDWYGVTHEPSMSNGDMKSMSRLERLSGEDYEIAFIRSMIRHHWAAVRESEKCLANAEHGQLVDLCSSIHDSQSEEIAIMQAWLDQWYGRSGGRPTGQA